jgi:hypothetical protein
LYYIIKYINIIKKIILNYGVLLVILSLFFYSCDKRDSNLIELKTETINKETHSLNSISSFNPMFENEYYNFLKNNINAIKLGLLDSSEVQDLVIYSNTNYTVLLSTEEQNIVYDYFQNQSLNLLSLSNFETYISNEITLQSNNIYKFIALSRVSLMIYDEEFDNPTRPNISEFENCLTQCIDNKLSEIFDDGNIVDQVLFMAGMPKSFLAIVASCSYGCYKETNKSVILAD